MKNTSDNNNNYNKSEPEEYFPPADQNNNSDSDVKKNFGDIRSRSSSKLRNHQMQQLLQQHVFTPHQVKIFLILKIRFSFEIPVFCKKICCK